MTTPQPAIVTPAPDSKLAQLRELYYRLKPDADRITEELKAVTDAIKVELAEAAPNERAVVLPPDTPDHPTLRMQAKESWRVDTKRLKAEQPATYTQFAYKSVSWDLRRVQ